MEELKEFELLGNKLSILVKDNGDLLFAAPDICNILVLTNVTEALRGLDEDEKLVSEVLRAGQKRVINFVTESGMYSLILRSNKEESKTFKKWVTNEVLPQIRKTGSYQSPVKKEFSRKELAQMILIAEEELEAANKLLESQTPKVEYADKVLSSVSDHTTTTIANELGISAIALNKKLKEAGVQYKHEGNWVLYAKYKHKGLNASRTHPYMDTMGNIQTEIRMVWTEEGRNFIHKMFNEKLNNTLIKQT